MVGSRGRRLRGGKGRGLQGMFVALVLVGGFMAIARSHVAAAEPASTRLKMVAETKSTITLAWTPIRGAGYRFSAQKQPMSKTRNWKRSRVTFAKGSSWFKVEAIGLSERRQFDVFVLRSNHENVVELPATVTASDFQDAVASAPPGPLTVRPRARISAFTVNGDVALDRAQVTIEHGAFQQIEFDPGSSGSWLLDSTVLAAHIYGADDVTWLRSTFDGQGVVAQNFILPRPSDNGVLNFRIFDSALLNYHVRADESLHSEALYIGALSEGLIQGNTFTDNGTTAHIFFTWFGGEAEADYPRNICVTGNRFQRSHNPAFAITVRPGIPVSANIRVDPKSNRSDTPHLIGNEFGVMSTFVRPCP